MPLLDYNSLFAVFSYDVLLFISVFLYLTNDASLWPAWVSLILQCFSIQDCQCLVAPVKLS